MASCHGSTCRITGPFVGGIHRWNSGFPHKGTGMCSLDVCFVVSNKLLSKYWNYLWFEMLGWSFDVTEIWYLQRYYPSSFCHPQMVIFGFHFLWSRTKLQWNWNTNSKYFIEENAFPNDHKMAAILFTPQCGNKQWKKVTNYGSRCSCCQFIIIDGVLKAANEEDWCAIVLARCQTYNIFGKIYTRLLLYFVLTHWGRVTHVCVGSLAIISPNNGLSPGRRQDIICTNAGILWIGPLVTNFSEILIKLYIFLFKKIPLKLSSGNWRLCFGLYVQILW